MIDAEQVKFAPAIDNLATTLQQEFNATDKSEYPIIYNTYQCYLKDSSDRLRKDVERSQRLQIHFGTKLCRGACLEQERLFAQDMGLPSPIHDTINDCVDFLLRHSVESDHKIELMCATHNQKSVELAIDGMNKYGIERSDHSICFSQLYGMADNLTFNLGKHGYRAYKYVPYGKVHEATLYLIRRASENSAIVKGASEESDMIKAELRRRFLGVLGRMGSDKQIFL